MIFRANYSSIGGFIFLDLHFSTLDDNFSIFFLEKDGTKNLNYPLLANKTASWWPKNVKMTYYSDMLETDLNKVITAYCKFLSAAVMV